MIKPLVIGVLALGTIGTGGIATLDASINPYRSIGDTLDIQKVSTIPHSGTIDSIVDTSQPKIILNKWGGQVSLGVTYTGIPDNTTGLRPFLSKSVQWKSGSQTMEAMPIDATTTMEDGGMEINLNLASKPSTNIFSFQLDNYQDLNFYYQAPLWQEAGLKSPTENCTNTHCLHDQDGADSSMSDNVVGSYAVYYKNHSGHVEGDINYGTGKAYQIYRPLVTDSNGSTTWANLSYSSGILTVTVPESFLDTAIYPVKVDPTFGYTTVGGTAVAQTSASRDLVSYASSRAASVAGDMATDIQIYSQCTVSGSGTLQTTLYATSSASTSGGKASETLSYTINSTTAQWYSQNLIPRLFVPGKSYAPAMGNFAIGTCTALNMFRDVTSGNQNSQTTSGGAFPDPFDNNANSASQYSLYVDYTTGNTTGGTNVGNSSTFASGRSTTYAARVPSQRLGFYAVGGYWQFWNNGSTEVYATSTDGVIWSAEATIVSGISVGAGFDIFYDSSTGKVSYVRIDANPGTAIFYRKGTPNANGTFTWDAVEQTVQAAGGGAFYGDPSISVDSNNNPWIGTVHNNGTKYDASWVYHATTTDGTWSNSTGFPYVLETADNHDAHIIPMTGGKVYAISYINWNTGVGTSTMGQLWNGTTWSAFERISNSNISVIHFQKAGFEHLGDDVYFAFLKESTFDIVVDKRTSGVGWGADTTVQASTVGSTTPILSSDGTNIYLIWQNSPTNNVIYAKAYNSACSTWDANPRTITNESTEAMTYYLGGNTGYGSAWESVGNGKIGLIYATTNVSPYTVKVALWNVSSDGCASAPATPISTFRGGSSIIGKGSGSLIIK